MKILRMTIVIVFLVVLAAFSYVFVNEKLNADYTYPEITINDDMIDVSLSATHEELLRGVTAYDEKDGDLTNKIIIESISKFVEPRVSVVTYAVCDGDNHVATGTRRIRYTEYTPPRFTMSGSLVYSLTDKIKITDVIGAVDVIDGDIGKSVIINASDFESNTEGVFTISVQASNSKGDVITMSLPIYVENNGLSAPEIELTDYLVYTKVCEPIDPQNYLKSISTENIDPESYMIDTDYNPDAAGTYQVHFYVTDTNGRKGHSILTIIVEE